MDSQNYIVSIVGTDSESLDKIKASSTDDATYQVKEKWNTSISSNVLVHTEYCPDAITFQVNTHCVRFGECRLYRVINGDIIEN